MTVDPAVSLAIVKKELEDCREDSSQYGWKTTGPSEAQQTFSVEMKSPIDDERYIIEIKFDNYKEYPLLIEFIDPGNAERGFQAGGREGTDGEGRASGQISLEGIVWR